MTMRNKTSLPASALTLIGAVIVAGVAAVALRIPELSSWGTVDLMAMLALVGAAATSEQFSLQVRFGSETKNITVTEAAFAAALLVGVRPSVLTVGAGLGILIGHTMRGTAAHKTAFNVGSYLAAVTAAEVVFAAMHPGSPFGAVALAMAAFFAVNASTVVGVIALVEGRSFVSVFRPIAAVEVLQSAGNAASGLLLAVVWMANPAVVPALVLAPVACYAVYRAVLHSGQGAAVPARHAR